MMDFLTEAASSFGSLCFGTVLVGAIVAWLDELCSFLNTWLLSLSCCDNNLYCRNSTVIIVRGLRWQNKVWLPPFATWQAERGHCRYLWFVFFAVRHSVCWLVIAFNAPFLPGAKNSRLLCCLFRFPKYSLISDVLDGSKCLKTSWLGNELPCSTRWINWSLFGNDLQSTWLIPKR